MQIDQYLRLHPSEFGIEDNGRPQDGGPRDLAFREYQDQHSHALASREHRDEQPRALTLPPFRQYQVRSPDFSRRIPTYHSSSRPLSMTRRTVEMEPRELFPDYSFPRGRHRQKRSRPERSASPRYRNQSERSHQPRSPLASQDDQFRASRDYRPHPEYHDPERR